MFSNFFLSLSNAVARPHLPAAKFFHFGQSLGPLDQTLSWCFIGVIMIGGLFFILASMSDIVLSAPGYRSLFGMYWAVWAAYGMWYVDVRFGLPFGLSRFHVLPVFLGAVAGTLLFQEIIGWLWGFFQPLEKGMMRCRHCREVISKLMIQCPYCNGKNS